MIVHSMGAVSLLLGSTSSGLRRDLSKGASGKGSNGDDETHFNIRIGREIMRITKLLE
jgi:hypothetical protein